MVFVPFVGVCRAVIGQTLLGEEISNTMWFKKDGYTFTDQQILAGVLWTAWASEVMPLMSSALALLRVQVYDMTSESAPVAIQTSTPVLGTSTADPVPPHTAMVVTLRTAGRGRSARGRLFISGFSEASIDGGEFPQAVRDTVVEAIENVHAAAAVEGWTAVIAQQWAEGSQLSQGFTRDITAVEVRNGIPGTMRRRLGRP